jgi:biotin carboxyl carrier protein
MRYYVTLDPAPGAAPTTVEVKELPTGALEVTVGGRKIDVDVVPVPGALSFRIDGKVVDLTTEGVPPELGAIASGHRSYVRVESERQKAADAAKKSKSGGAERLVKSPMPGRVVKILVQKGDEVEPGQPLMVIEAMKMENEIKAKAKGKVLEVHAVAGATVEGNAKLITLE